MSQLLAAIPSLPRAELARLTACMIDRLDDIDGDPDAEDDDRGAILMVAPGVDYDPAEDRPCIPDGLPGDPDDAEDDDPAGGEITDEPHDDDDPAGGAADDVGEPGSWPEGFLGSAPVAYADDDYEEDGDDIQQRRRRIRENRRA